MKSASWAASNRRLAFKVPTLESQKSRGVWQWCSGSCNSKSLSDKVAIIPEPKEVDKSPHQNQFAFSLGAHPRVILVLGCFRHVALWPLSVQWTKWGHLHWTQCRRSESTKDRPHTALYQGIDAVLKDLVAAPEACRRVTCGMMCCDVLRTLSIVTYCYTLISFDIIIWSHSLDMHETGLDLFQYVWHCLTLWLYLVLLLLVHAIMLFGASISASWASPHSLFLRVCFSCFFQVWMGTQYHTISFHRAAATPVSQIVI